MPVYEYTCDECSLRFELRQRFADESEYPCPECRGRTRRVFSPVSVVFKGAGFYGTDSRKGGAAPT